MRRTLLLLARGALPAIVVATLIPMTLFYAALAAGSVFWAIGVSVLYAYAMVAYQHIRNHRVSGMLLITAFMATVRAVTAIASGHAMVYFAIPIVETVGFALMFLATMFSREPLVVRLARDLVPGAAEELVSHRSLIRSLSLVWTVTYLGNAATTLLLLVSTPMSVFLGAHTVAGWLWTGCGAAASVLICRSMAAGLLATAWASADPTPTSAAAPMVVAQVAA
jgi:hypothetical protein